MWHNVKYRSQQPPAVPPATLVSLLLRELGRMPDHRALLKAMIAGLRVQTLWYAIAGSPANAGRAALLARATATLPITDNPLVAGLLAKGFARRAQDRPATSAPSSERLRLPAVAGLMPLCHVA